MVLTVALTHCATSASLCSAPGAGLVKAGPPRQSELVDCLFLLFMTDKNPTRRRVSVYRLQAFAIHNRWPVSSTNSAEMSTGLASCAWASSVGRISANLSSLREAIEAVSALNRSLGKLVERA